MRLLKSSARKWRSISARPAAPCSQLPPPDLLIEVVVSHGPKKALGICLLLGIPEVWVHRPRGARLHFLLLEDGKYVSKSRSRSFPFLGPEDVIPWLTSPEDEPDNRWRRRLRDWVRDVLAPRRAGG
jgi:Uma2 family endonuclease